MFELRYRDAMGRIGILHVKDQKVETPLLLPVVNPSFQQITAKEMQKMGFPGVITNAYLINKDASLRERALKKGVHKLIGFDGIVMTDSGSYQLYEYGSVNVGPEEIVKFQRDIGADIGVILDIPSAPDIDVEDAKRDVAETLKRAKESIPLKGSMLLCGTIQGSTYPELRERAAKEMGGLDFDIHPIGGVVPLMADYRFKELAEVVMSAKMHLPPERPVHLFGCGHPMIFALACAMGCDIFDSAAYALYARDGRYITAGGTLKLIELREFPCSCTACSDSTPKEIMELDEEGRTDMLSRHNLYASLEEIKRVKQSIYEGSLLELVEKQARSHPYLLDALRQFLSHDIERWVPVTKHSAFFYSGPESLQRPEVKRHLARLDEIEKGETLVLLPDTGKPYSKAYDTASTAEHHICIASPVFGIIPLEIAEVYPLGQHERPDELDIEQIGLMKKRTTEYAKEFKRVLVHKDLEFLGIEGETFEDVSEFKVDRRASKNVELKLRAIGDYQFGKGAGKALMYDIEARWARTGRIRRVYSIGELIATLRPSDGSIILATEGARRLLELPFPKNRVVVSKDAVEFVREGKSVFAGFVAGCDPQMRPYQEVIAVSEEDEFLATGRALLNSEEMRAFKRGVAVKIRHKAPQ
ncbi:MAG: tRNA guanosine(15) transglycosylase TgtA [Candidatus Hydrothermarchaeaceae archaeon]